MAAIRSVGSDAASFDSVASLADELVASGGGASVAPAVIERGGGDCL
jgi:hypothetical protein